MQVTAYNQKQLDVIVRDVFNEFDKHGELNISYDKPFKDKTKNQRGYIFGGLVKSIYTFYDKRYSVNSIKNFLYKICSEFDERLVDSELAPDGKIYDIPKRLSDMDAEESSIFIDCCIRAIDNSPYFEGLVLHPSLRYTWIRHVTADELKLANEFKFPRQCPEYLEHTRKLNCIGCGIANHSQAHHLKLAGESGTSYKADDWLTIPLCHDCHIEDLHQHGQQTFYKGLEWITKYVSLVEFCRLRYLRWLNKV